MMNGNVCDLDIFFQTIKKDLEKKITSTITDAKIVSILEGGKRLRPVLAHLVFKTCTLGKEAPDQYQKVLESAVSIELAHNASLVNGDIIDKDKELRGKPTFHIEDGIDSVILMVHKMLAFGFNIALKHGEEITKLYADTWNEILNGELEEVNFNNKYIKSNTGDLSKSKIFAEYNKIIDMKTACIFSSACKVGAIEANASGPVLTIFAGYGREIGLAYQLANDLADLAKGEILNSAIVPLVITLDNVNMDKNPIKEKNLGKNFNKNSSELRELFISEIKKHVRKAEELSKSDTIPKSPYKDMLTAYIINKVLKEIGMKI
jgi:geranylgeranyl pyrophosphate synthase